MGTEDAQLLMEEYEMQKQRLARADKSVTPEQEKRLDHLLAARDSFIAERIAATLQEGEVGLLFLGALHRLDAFRAADIRLATLGKTLHEAVRRPGT